MNSTLESGLKDWLIVEGVAVPVFTGFTGGAQPTKDQTVTVFVPDSERAAGPLYRSTVKFIIATPPHDETDPDASLANHRATVGTIRGLLEAELDSLKTTIEANTSLYWHGGYMRDGGESTIDGGKWVTTIDYLAGIATEAIG